MLTKRDLLDLIDILRGDLMDLTYDHNMLKNEVVALSKQIKNGKQVKRPYKKKEK